MPHPRTLLLVLMPVVKEQQRKDSRTWNGPPNSFPQEAALADYRARIIHLASSDGALLETPESKPSEGDIRLLDVRDKAHSKVIAHTCHSLAFAKVSCNSRAAADCAVLSQVTISDQNFGRMRCTPPHGLLRLPPLN